MNQYSVFFQDLFEHAFLILEGLEQTLVLTGMMSVSGLLMGVMVFYWRSSCSNWIRWITQSYISFFIGTPVIVLLFLMYYGLPRWGISFTPFTVALIGFTFNIAAYNASYLMTAFNGFDKSEIEAAHAQGFSDLQTFRLIVLPQVLRLSVPALTNQVIRNLKDSSFVFLIQYTELFARVQELASANFQFFKAYLFAAIVYLILVSMIVMVARVIEKWAIIPGVYRITSLIR